MRLYSASFFEADSEVLARQLLGKLLCIRLADGQVFKRRITETESYGGADDSASHAFRGQTKRNTPMFSRGGTIYAYLCYGLFNLLNIVSGREGDPQGVLIRGVEGAAGPGLVGRLFGIERSLSGSDITNKDSSLWLEDDGFVPPEIKCLPRVGIVYASKADRERLARFKMV